MLSAPETNLAQCVADGKAYLAQKDILPANLIRRVCLDFPAVAKEYNLPASQVSSFGIEIHNATIIDDIDLRGAKLGFGLRFHDCTFEGRLFLSDLEINHITFFDCTIKKGMSIENIKVEGNIDLSKTTFEKIEQPILDADTSSYHRSSHANTILWARAIHVRGSMILTDANFSGEVFLVNANIGGSLHLSGAKFTSDSDKYALCGYGARVGGTLYLRQVSVDAKEGCGCISFQGARIGTRIDAYPASGTTQFRSLDLRYTHIDGAADFSGCIFHEYLDLMGAEITGDLNLEEAWFQGKGTESDRDLKDWCLRGRNLKVGGSMVLGRDIQQGVPQRNTIPSRGWFNKTSTPRICVCGALDFVGAQIGRNLVLDQIHLYGKVGKRNRALVAAGAQVHGSLLIRNSIIEHAVDLRNAKIGAQLSFQDSELLYSYEKLSEEERKRVVRYPALTLRGAKVGLDLLFGNEDAQDGQFGAEGRLKLTGAQVDGNLVFHKATIKGKIESESIKVGQSVKIIESEFSEVVDFSKSVVGIDFDFVIYSQTGRPLKPTTLYKTFRIDGANIGGNLICRGCRFGISKVNGDQKTDDGGTHSQQTSRGGYKLPTDYCIYAASLTVGQSVFLDADKPSEQSSDRCFQAHGAVNFADARIGRQFDCRGGQFLHNGDRCLYAPRIEVGGDMNLCVSAIDLNKRFTAKGTVRMPSARIRGDLDCGGGKFEGKKYSLYAPGIYVGGSVYLNADALLKTRYLFEASGCVRINGARIGQNLDCRGGKFSHIPEPASTSYETEPTFVPEAYAFYAPNVQVGGDVYLSIQTSTEKRFLALGPVNFAAAKVEGRFDCRGGQFHYSGTRCLFAPLLEVGRRMYLSAWVDKTPKGDDIVYHFEAKGTVHLSNARISGDLDCGGGNFRSRQDYSIFASDMVVGGSLYMGRATHGKACFYASGCVRLDGTTIGLNWDCGGGVFAKFSTACVRQPLSPHVYCLYAAGLTAAGNINLSVSRTGERFRALGSVSLERVKVDGNLDCRGGFFWHSGEFCLCAPRLIVGHAALFGVVRNDNRTSRFTAYGTVNLSGASIGGDLDLGGAQIGASGTQRYSLYATGMQVEGNLYLNCAPDAEVRTIRFATRGCVRLDGSKIRGNLDCRGGEFQLSEPQQNALQVKECNQTPYTDAWVYSLYAPNIDVGGNLYCGVQPNSRGDRSSKIRFEAHGPVSFAASKIGGHFDCTGGKFAHDGSRCIYAPQVEVGRRLKLGYDPDEPDYQFEAQGAVQLQGARIHNDFDCGGGKFRADKSYNDVPEHCALHAPGLQVGGNIYLNKYPRTDKKFESEGDVIIEGSTIEGSIEAEGGEIKGGALHAADIRVGRSVYLGKSGGEKELFNASKINLSKAEIGHSLEVHGVLRWFDLSNATVKGSFIFAARDDQQSEGQESAAQGVQKFSFLTYVNSMWCLIGVKRFKDILEKIEPRKESTGQPEQSQHDSGCDCPINLQNASVDLWDDLYVFPEIGDESSKPLRFFWKMSREQLLRAAAYDLSGFTYTTLGEHLLKCIQKYPREVGLWFNFSKVCTYDPQPYEQLAEVLKKHGEEAGYAAIVVAKRREHRQHVEPDGYLKWIIIVASLTGLISSIFSYCFNIFNEIRHTYLFPSIALFLLSFVFTRFFFKLAGLIYDFVFLHFPVHLIERPWRAPAYATIIWLTFSLFYTTIDAKSHMAPAEGHLQYYLSKEYREKGEAMKDYAEAIERKVQGYPTFNPFLYTLDRLVPFVDFAQSDAWIPDGSKPLGQLLWYSDWLLRITGFYLVTVLLGAVTGLVKAEKL